MRSKELESKLLNISICLTALHMHTLIPASVRNEWVLVNARTDFTVFQTWSLLKAWLSKSVLPVVQIVQTVQSRPLDWTGLDCEIPGLD